MREIRTKTSSAVGAVDCVAVQAGRALEHMSSRSFFFILVRWLLLLVCPCLEVFRAIYVHAQEHLCVLCPAVLRTLPEKQARIVRIQPHLVRVIRNQVRLSCKLRHPEAVIGVCGEQFQECRCWMSGVTHGDMEFVRGDDAKRGISKFPPKLVPYCGHLHSPFRLRRVLDRVNHLGCSGEQHRNDENGNHGPSHFNLRASIQLRWLSFRLSPSAAELHHGVTQQTEDDQKNQSSDAEDEVRQMTDRLRWCGMRFKDARNRVVLRSSHAQSCNEKNPQ